MRWGLYRNYHKGEGYKYIGGSFLTLQEAKRAARKYRRKNKLTRHEVFIQEIICAE